MGATSLTILSSICFVWASLAGRHAFELRKSHDNRGCSGWAFWAILPAAIFALISLSTIGADLVARNLTLGILGAALGASAFIWVGYIVQASPSIAQTVPAPPADPQPPASPGSSGNFSINQQGGNNYQTYINKVPEKLRFTDKLGAELLEKISKDKPIIVRAIGSNSDREVGIQIFNFLRANGYQSQLQTIGMLAPPPDRPLTLTSQGDSLILTVAPGAN